MRPLPGMDTPEHSARLAARIRSGDEASLGAWYESEWPRVYRLCLGYLTDPAAAEEAARDAMHHLQDVLARWPVEVPYARWSTTVVANRCRDVLRRREVRGRCEAAAAAQGLGMPGPAQDPAVAAGLSEVQALLVESLRHLPPREREVFLLRDLEGHGFADIAAAMGTSPSAARALLSSARQRLRGLLSRHVANLPGSPP
jgi:RNA polymerase sigma-70 factor (ECF subfamily)